MRFTLFQSQSSLFFVRCFGRFFICLILMLGIVTGIMSTPHVAYAKKEKAKRPHPLAIVHNNRGVTALYENKPDRALFEFKTAVELDPTYIEAQTNVGVAQKLLGQLSAARASFEKAISLDKSYATPYNHLGTIYFAEKNYAQAMELFNTALKKNKKFADAWINLGLTFIAMANEKNQSTELLSQAIEPLREATSIDTSYSRAHLELAKIYERLGDFEKAIIRYKLSLETDPNNLDSWIALGTLYVKKEETLQAKTAFTRAIQLSPQSPAAHLNLGLAYLKESNFPLAISEFESALQFAPTSEMAHYNLGYTAYLIGNQQHALSNESAATAHYEKAVQSYAEAFRLNPTLTDAAYNAGHTLGLLNRLSEARTWYAHALENDPKHTRSLLALGMLEADQGHAKEASQYLCRAIQGTTPLTPEEKSLVDGVLSQTGGCH